MWFSHTNAYRDSRDGAVGLGAKRYQPVTTMYQARAHSSGIHQIFINILFIFILNADVA